VSERWDELVATRNETTRAAGRWRTIRSLRSGTPATTIVDGDRHVVSFASNDYLGLSQHPAVVAAAASALSAYGAGAGAARLIVGSRPVHDELEAALAARAGRHAALLFPTGFQANLGVIGALVAAAPQVVVYSDELNHASIIDGIRASRAQVQVYRHADVAHLAELMGAAPDRPALVVTDSVFSMDGDLAPLAELAELCDTTDALLVLDEAHAVLGPESPHGAVVVGTLSKTLGAVGGYVAADRSVIELCINTARSFIFTTAGAPADAAAALAALEVAGSDEGDRLRARLRANIDLLRPGHPSPIVPILLGSEDRAVQVADALVQRGLLVPAIRPPTVAPGTCRLRVALSAAHTTDDVLALRDALDQLGVAP
jgi:8-amino-7-oxononanoate synthase